MARRIVITSGKGGVGKTTITANLGMKLALRGLRVAVLDLDLGLNNLDVALGLENKIVFDISDAVSGRCRLKQALVQSPQCNSLFLLPSLKNSFEMNTVTAQNVKLVVNKLSEVFDYVLIDCPAGIDLGFERAIKCVDEAILVTTPTISSIRDADKVLSILKSHELQSVRVVINRLRGDMVVAGEMLDAFEIFSLLKARPLGILPEDDMLNFRTANEMTDEMTSDTAFEMLATNLHEEKSDFFDCVTRYKGFFGSLRRKIKRRA